MPRDFLQLDADVLRPYGFDALERRPVVTNERALAEHPSTEIRLQAQLVRDDALLRQVQASTRGRVGPAEKLDYSPMNDLTMIASLGMLGTFVIILADLHVLGLI